jgi:hypothetical protein
VELELDCDAARRDGRLLCLPGHGNCADWSPCCVAPRAPAARGGCLPLTRASRCAGMLHARRLWDARSQIGGMPALQRERAAASAARCPPAAAAEAPHDKLAV